jgi:archaellum component FlaD/FlaE
MDELEVPQKTAGVVPVETAPVETHTSIPSQALSRFSLLTGRRSNRAKEDGLKEEKKQKEKQKEKERDKEKEKGREKEKESEKVKEVEREKRHVKEPSTERLSSVSASKIFPSLMKGAGSTVDLKKASGSDIPQVTYNVHSTVMKVCLLVFTWNLFF